MDATKKDAHGLSLLVPAGADGIRIDLDLEVTLGEQHLLLGKLCYHHNSTTACSMFTYSRHWLERATRFNVSPDLRLVRSSQCQRARTPPKPPFFGSLTDTLPGGFAKQVLERAVGRGLLNRPANTSDGVSHVDLLCGVLDHGRLGALRLRPHNSRRWNNPADAKLLPTMVDLDQIVSAAKALEQKTEDQRQLMLLLYSATALSGSRPKCSLILEDGTLAVAKLPSVCDRLPVARAEVLATELAKAAGIRVVNAQLKLVHYDPVVVMPRFDRQPNGRRWLYIRATSLLQAQGEQSIAYPELLEAMRQHCKDFTTDARELWRRLVFKRLVNQSKTDLSKIDFLHVGKDQWTLAPAYDLTPSLPDGSADQQEGPCLAGLDDLQRLMLAAKDFQMDTVLALELLAHLVQILDGWTLLASTFAVGMRSHEIQQLHPVFDNTHMQQAKSFLKS